MRISSETVEIKITFTSPICPLGPFIIESVRDKVSSVTGVKDVKVEITFEPIWTPDRISDEVRGTLGF